MTYRHVCEFVAGAFCLDGKPLLPEHVWNLSFRGELWPVHTLHGMALERQTENGWTLEQILEACPKEPYSEELIKQSMNTRGILYSILFSRR